jgi:phosphoribosylformylglycinamidine (FGAM) synthase-like enzyme
MPAGSLPGTDGTGAVIAIQDMGAAGLTCSAVEMGDKGDLGIDLTSTRCRCAKNMTAYEMMLSESQERMLMVLRPEKEAEPARLRQMGPRFRHRRRDHRRGSLPDPSWQRNGRSAAVGPVGSEAPEYDRPWVPPAPPPWTRCRRSTHRRAEDADRLAQLLPQAPGSTSNTTHGHGRHAGTPGGGAGVVRVHGTDKALAFTSDVTPRYVRANPFEGGKQAVAEAFRNLTAVGAKPLATTDNLNFGNPEKPEIMGQFVGAIKGHRRGLCALDMPIVSGNVSLYNETDGQAILPTPTIGAVGLLAAFEMAAAAGCGLAIEEGDTAWFFAEDQGRYLLAVPAEHAAGLVALAGQQALPARAVGSFCGDLVALGPASAPLADLVTLWSGAFAAALG